MDPGTIYWKGWVEVKDNEGLWISKGHRDVGIEDVARCVKRLTSRVSDPISSQILNPFPTLLNVL